MSWGVVSGNVNVSMIEDLHGPPPGPPGSQGPSVFHLVLNLFSSNQTCSKLIYSCIKLPKTKINLIIIYWGPVLAPKHPSGPPGSWGSRFH